jgi:nicotinamidase-related amidase
MRVALVLLLRAVSLATAHPYLPAAVETSMPNLQELEQLEAYWHLRGHKKPALLIQEVIKEYEPFLWRIRPKVLALVQAFRKAGFPIFWSTWWRLSPQLLERMRLPKAWARNHTNELDRLFGPLGIAEKDNGNFLYQDNGWEVLPEIAPETSEEKERVQRKWRMDCFAESEWAVPVGQGSLAQELRKLGVDMVVNTGVWTDACVVATAFGGMNADFDVVTVTDAVDTVTTGQQAALYVIQGAAGKLAPTAEVLRFLSNHTGTVNTTVSSELLVAASENKWEPLSRAGNKWPSSRARSKASI